MQTTMIHHMPLLTLDTSIDVMSCPRFITLIPFITYNSFNQYMHISLISLPFKPSKRAAFFFLRKKKNSEVTLVVF